jgi:hypothetical protein
MPQTTANSRTDLLDHNRNPSSAVAGGQTVTLLLTFDTSKVFVPEDLWDALITKYGAGKVTNLADSNSKNVYRWLISP